MNIDKKQPTKVYNALIWFLVAVVGLFIALLSVLLSPLFYILNIKSRRWKKGYHEYLKTVEGTKFFCYTNKRTTKAFVENEILPRLDNNIHVIFLESHKLHTEYNADFMKYAIWGKQLPCLMKIENGNMIYNSIHKKLNDAIRDNNKFSDLLLSLQQIMERLDAGSSPA